MIGRLPEWRAYPSTVPTLADVEFALEAHDEGNHDPIAALLDDMVKRDPFVSERIRQVDDKAGK